MDLKSELQQVCHFLMSDVMAVGIQANVERIFCLTHILRLAKVALDDVFSVPGDPLMCFALRSPFSHVDRSGI